MALILTDLSNVTFYTFPSDFDLHGWTDRDFQARSKLVDRMGRHGASEMSDRAIKPRVVTVKGAHHAASQAALKTFLDDLGEALHYNGEVYRFSWESGYYINVSHVKRLKVKRHKEALAYKSVDVAIEFECPDPFWYSTTDDTDGGTTITTSPQNITFTNNGNVPAPLKAVRAPTSACADWTLENATDEDNLFRYADPNLGNGDTATIDAQDGTVERDSINTKRFFSGAFLRVLPGANTITYTGPTGGTITLTAPRRYL